MTEALTKQAPVKIAIRNLYKIFGAAPEAALDRVRAGTSKAKLLEESSGTGRLRPKAVVT